MARPLPREWGVITAREGALRRYAYPNIVKLLSDDMREYEAKQVGRRATALTMATSATARGKLEARRDAYDGNDSHEATQVGQTSTATTATWQSRPEGSCTAYDDYDGHDIYWDRGKRDEDGHELLRYREGRLRCR